MKLRITANLFHAKPQVLDSSLFFLKLVADPEDSRSFLMGFYSPKIRSQVSGGEPTYRIEIGDKGTNQIRKDLNKLVIPQMRGDILEEDRATLEKVLFRLRKIVLDSASEYQGLSEEERKSWKNFVRMDITKFSDVGVKIQEEGEPAVQVASLRILSRVK